MTRMLLVRHGQSEWNAEGRWQGQADPPLSDLGREQAARAADRLGAVDAIVSSDLDRALATAAILAQALGVGPVLVEPRLRERSAGEWSGLTREQVEQAWPGYLAERRRPPGWEPDDAVLARVRAALGAIEAAQPGAEVLVVTHGGVVYALEAEAELPFSRLPNLGARWITHDGRHIRIGDRIDLVDEAQPAGPVPEPVPTSLPDDERV